MFQQAKQINQELFKAMNEPSSVQGWAALGAAFPWYPWASIGAAVDHPDDESFLQKAGLFVHHPLQLQLMITPQPESPSLLQGEVQATIETSLPDKVEVALDEEPFAEPEPAEPVTAPSTEIAEAELAPQPVENESKPALPGSPVLDAASATADELPAFQPYYTVDYFASQGIKADLNALPKTRFDTQLRSFTQWLKTMKRVDYQATEGQSADPLVQQQAQRSLQQSEVVTESMAEVLIKQGKHQQAIEILAKLILLHPEKSHFFAAQIESLKAQQ